MTELVASQRRLIWKLARAEFERLKVRERVCARSGRQPRLLRAREMRDAADEAFARALEEACE